MRTAVLVGKTRSGEFVTLAHPDTSIVDQKLFLKQIRNENGRGILINNVRTDLAEVMFFESGSGKTIRFKQPVKVAKSVDHVTTLDAMAEALGIKREELDALRKEEGFPVKEKDGYNVGAVKVWMALKQQASAGTGGENKTGDEE